MWMKNIFQIRDKSMLYDEHRIIKMNKRYIQDSKINCDIYLTYNLRLYIKRLKLSKYVF